MSACRTPEKTLIQRLSHKLTIQFVRAYDSRECFASVTRIVSIRISQVSLFLCSFNDNNPHRPVCWCIELVLLSVSLDCVASSNASLIAFLHTDHEAPGSAEGSRRFLIMIFEAFSYDCQSKSPYNRCLCNSSNIFTSAISLVYWRLRNSATLTDFICRFNSSTHRCPRCPSFPQPISKHNPSVIKARPVIHTSLSLTSILQTDREVRGPAGGQWQFLNTTKEIILEPNCRSTLSDTRLLVYLTFSFKFDDRNSLFTSPTAISARSVFIAEHRRGHVYLHYSHLCRRHLIQAITSQTVARGLHSPTTHPPFAASPVSQRTQAIQQSQPASASRTYRTDYPVFLKWPPVS